MGTSVDCLLSVWSRDVAGWRGRGPTGYPCGRSADSGPTPTSPWLVRRTSSQAVLTASLRLHHPTSPLRQDTRQSPDIDLTLPHPRYGLIADTFHPSVCRFVCLSVILYSKSYERILMSFWSGGAWFKKKSVSIMVEFGSSRSDWKLKKNIYSSNLYGR